jgi:hypothetical protein
MQILLANDQKPYTNFTWRFQGRTTPKEYWFQYNECVYRPTSEPKLQYKHCHHTFAHPDHNKEATTAGIKEHLNSRCIPYQRYRSNAQ